MISPVMAMRTVDAPGNCTDKHRKSMDSGAGQRNRKAGKRRRSAMKCGGIVQTDENGYGKGHELNGNAEERI